MLMSTVNSLTQRLDAATTNNTIQHLNTNTIGNMTNEEQLRKQIEESFLCGIKQAAVTHHQRMQTEWELVQPRNRHQDHDDSATTNKSIKSHQTAPDPPDLRSPEKELDKRNHYLLLYPRGFPPPNQTLYIKFPIESTIMGLTDANWGPRDQQKPKPTDKPLEVDIFKSQSLSGFLLWLSGPIHWVSKC